ncbi:MAG: putative ABC transporter permease [Raoultibacter sp.]
MKTTDRGIAQEKTVAYTTNLISATHLSSMKQTASRAMLAQEPSSALRTPTLFWIFVIGSIAGLLIEIAFHAVIFGGYESRAGLVWGPFSPIYGVGAVVLTIVSSRFSQANAVAVFFIAALAGSTVEFATSWAMEVFFGAVAWDYSGTFGNIDGRVNVTFALMWGALGLGWTRLVMPHIEKSAERIDWNCAPIRIVSIACAVLMAVNIVVTIQALGRESARMDAIAAETPIDHFLDEHFPSTWMQAHFENMSIMGVQQR